MKNRSRLLTVLLYIVVFAVAVVLISEVFFRDDTAYVNYSTVCEQFRSENVRSFEYDNGVLTLELRKPYQNEAYSVSHKLADLGLFYEDLGTLIAEQQESGVLQSYNYVPMRQTPWYVRMLPEMLLSVIMIALVYMVLMRNSGGMMKFGHANARVGSGRDKVMFSDVAGADEEKAELQEIVDFLRDPAKYRRIGARIPKGVLLVGPPGTGKTLLARACAGEAGVPFYSISGSDFVEMYVGVGASRVRDLFDKAKKTMPCIIFIDEIDAVGRQRGAGLGGGHDEREQTLNQLLVEMDGFEANDGVIVMAATNRADILDKALLRPGRFDRQVYVGLPDVKGREEILKVHTKNKPLAPDVSLRVIAQRTAGFAGADLENLVNEAALLAARRSRKAITMEDIEEASMKVMAGPEKKSRVVTPEEKKLTAYHEAGHAVQYAVGYGPIRLRNAIIPVCNFGSQLSILLIVIGLFLYSQPLFGLGVILFGVAVLGQVVTLPVEFNASRRALESLEGGYLLDDEELRGARKVLSAAAMTYVAALLVSLAQLLRFVLAFNGRRRD